MDVWIFLGLVVGITLVLFYRSRRGTTGPEASIQGLPNDHRDAHTIHSYQGGYQGHTGPSGPNPGGFDGSGGFGGG